MTPHISDPYARGKLEYDSITNDLNARIRNWQYAAFLLGGCLILALGGWIVSMSKAKTIPYVIEVDQLGRAQSIAPAQEYHLSDEKVIRAFLYQYLDMVRTIVSDADAIKRNLDQVYKISTPGVRSNVLDKFYQGDDPFLYAQKKGTRHVEPLSFLRQGEDAYIIEWREIERNYENQILGESRYKAYVSIVQIAPTKEDQYKENPFNPFGIHVTSLSWSKLM